MPELRGAERRRRRGDGSDESGGSVTHGALAFFQNGFSFVFLFVGFLLVFVLFLVLFCFLLVLFFLLVLCFFCWFFVLFFVYCV